MVSVSFHLERILGTRKLCEELMELRGKEKSVRAEIEAKEREKKSVEEEVKALEEKERTESEKKSYKGQKRYSVLRQRR